MIRSGTRSMSSSWVTERGLNLKIQKENGAHALSRAQKVRRIG